MMSKEDQQVELLIELICEAAPLMWVVNQNMEEAATWEAKAHRLIQELRTEK